MSIRRIKLVPATIAAAICLATAGASYALPPGPSPASLQQTAKLAQSSATHKLVSAPKPTAIAVPAPTSEPSASSPTQPMSGCKKVYDQHVTTIRAITIVSPFTINEDCQRRMAQRPTITVDPHGIVDLDGVCQATFAYDAYLAMGAIRLASYISNLCEKTKNDSWDACLIDARRLVNDDIEQLLDRNWIAQVCSGTGDYQMLKWFFDE